MTRITIDNILSWHPCKEYQTRELLLEVTNNRESLTPLEVSHLDISTDDRLWVLLRPEVLGRRDLTLCVCDYAEHVAHLWHAPEGCSWQPSDTLDVVRRYARGEATDEELDIAAWVARVARVVRPAWVAAGVAKAAWVAAAATNAAARAAWAAMAATADIAAEREWQLARLRTYIEEPQP